MADRANTAIGRSRSQWSLVMAIAVTLSLAAACTGDDDDADDTSPSTTSEVSDSTTTSTTPATTTMSTTTSTSTTTTISASLSVTTTTPADDCTTVLEVGCVGDDVERLQRLLRTRVVGSVQVDGDFGPQTANALRKFESKCDECLEDGRIRIDGPEWTALDAIPSTTVKVGEGSA